MVSTSLPLTWQVGPADGPHAAVEQLVPAIVPGAVQLDWAAATNLPDYTIGNNVTAWSGLDERHWHYVTTFANPALTTGQRLIFTSLGIDYACIIFINDTQIHQQEGMFTPVRLDVTDHLTDTNTLRIVITPAPRCYRISSNNNAERGSIRHLATDSCKPAVAYGWDWHPVLIPLGIWDDTALTIRDSLDITQVRTTQHWHEQQVTVATDIITTHSDGHIRWTLQDPTGHVVHQHTYTLRDTTTRLSTAVAKPHLWWPRGYGAQHRYRSTVTCVNSVGTVVAEQVQSIGLRTVALTMHPGAWDEPRGFPKTRSVPPVTVTVNGQTVFCKGTNWVPPDIFPGRITAETYRPLIQFACDLNFNTLRIWGGGIVNKDSFFEQCDEAGLFVFSEFPLACNPYGDDPHYLSVLKQEATSIVSRFGHHACIALWCGGNELFNGWSGMTDQSLPIRLLNSLCFELDPQRPFMPTFPVMGMGHGPYTFLDCDSGEEVISIVQNSAHTALSEFGSPGPSPAAYIRAIIPEAELWPPTANSSWRTHHAFAAWRDDTWLCWDALCRIYGEPANLDELCDRGLRLQAIGYQAIFEEARRQAPVCSMAINWCFNEPWPSAANNSIINYPAQPKPFVFEAVRDACREILLSARIPRYVWTADSLLTAELSLINDSQHDIPAGNVAVDIHFGKTVISIGHWAHPALTARSRALGPMIRWHLTADLPADWQVVLRHADNAALSNAYPQRLRITGQQDTRRLNE